MRFTYFKPFVLTAVVLNVAPNSFSAKTVDLSDFPELQKCEDCTNTPSQTPPVVLEPMFEKMVDDAPPFMQAQWELNGCLGQTVRIRDARITKQNNGSTLTAHIRNALAFEISGIVFRVKAEGFPRPSRQPSSTFEFDPPLAPNEDQMGSVTGTLELNANLPDSFAAELIVIDVIDTEGTNLINAFTLSSLETFDQARFETLKRRLCETN